MHPLSRRALIAGAAGAATAVVARRAAAQDGATAGDSEAVAVADSTPPHVAVRQLESHRATVLVLGDSIVAGTGLVDRSRRWTDQLQALVRRDSLTATLTIVNAGVPGQSIASHVPPFEGGGGRLVDHVRLVIPEGTPPERVPRVAVVVPSINELMASQEPSAQDQVAFALNGVRIVVDYLRWVGVAHVVVPPMVVPTLEWDRQAPSRTLDEVETFNETLLRTDLVTPVDYGMGGPARGSDPRWYDGGDGTGNDGLHPGPDGHTAIARALFTALRALTVTW